MGLFACGGDAAAIDAGATDASLDHATSDATVSDASDAALVDAGLVDAPSSPDSGGGACDAGACPQGLTCCGGQCKNLVNDPLNCSQCGQGCSGATPMCLGGVCSKDICQPTCGTGQVCCQVNKGGPSGPPTCYQGTTCPVGCPLCK